MLFLANDRARGETYQILLVLPMAPIKLEQQHSVSRLLTFLVFLLNKRLTMESYLPVPEIRQKRVFFGGCRHPELIL